MTDKNIKDKTKKLLYPLLTVLTAPLAIMVIVLLAYRNEGAYPFGDGTVAWGDMIQQVIPLLADLKDILSGKDGVFLNLHNAAGMNMWAVIFFFLASPFSLLVVFVEKTELMHFANILVMLKLMLCGATASLYLYKSFRKADPIWVAALGVLYGLSGYGLLYYQNVIWLDMMYLFPLLLLTLEMLCDKKRVLPYTAVLAAMMVVNYYIGYMVVIFIMLFIGLTLMGMRGKSGDGAAVRFVTGSALAALVSAVVWLPSLLQYTKSGRVEDEFFSSVRSCSFLTNIETVLPTILCSAFVLTATLLFTADGRPRSKRLNCLLIMALLTAVPLIVQPINLMWHTGDYMSFPSRYGFITEFLLVSCTAAFLEDKDGVRMPEKKKHADHILLLTGALAGIYLLVKTLISFIDNNRKTASAYVGSLWGDRDSLSICLSVFFMMSAAFALLLTLYRKGWLSSRVLAILCAVLIGCEGYVNLSVYLTYPVFYYPERAADQNKVYNLADRINDSDGMYRVKTDGKLFYVNLVGALGYGSISHYTSLNSQDYMFMMKQLGYSANWMDVGSYGGTELTDMLMSVKYEIVRGEAENAVYTNGDYSIVPCDEWLPSGLVVDSIGCEELPEVSRGEIQKLIYDNTLAQYGGEGAVQVYELDGTSDGSGYTVTNGGDHTLELDISGRQTVYFDAFDHPEVSLGSDIDKTFNVTVNGNTIKTDYPNGDFNGILCLGEFENEHITVNVKSKYDISMKSLGVITEDRDKLKAAAENAETVNFTQKGGRLTGSVNGSSGQKCLINVPYTDGLNVEINGKKVPCQRAYGDLTAVELTDGENNITVTATAKGLGAGILLSVIGLALCAAWHFILSKKLKAEGKAATILKWAVTAASGAVFIIVYVVPVFVNIVNKKDA